MRRPPRRDARAFGSLVSSTGSSAGAFWPRRLVDDVLDGAWATLFGSDARLQGGRTVIVRLVCVPQCPRGSDLPWGVGHPWRCSGSEPLPILQELPCRGG
eukprot:6685948-Pyramimonas_sp.AAC.1